MRARIELSQNVGRDRYRLAEHDLADVDSHVGLAVHGFRKLWCGRGEFAFAFFTVAVELQVREMKRQFLRGGNCRQRGLEISGKPKIVAVNMQWMRHAESIQRALQGFHNSSRRHPIGWNDIV